MGTVYSLEIYQANVSKCAGKEAYQVETYWTVTESPQKFQGNYLVQIIKSTEVIASMEVDSEARSVEFKELVLNEKAYYILKISVKDQPAVTDFTPLLLCTYENTGGSYDGSRIKLHWDKPDINICRGKCSIKTRNNGIFTHKVQPYISGMEIPFEEKYFGIDEVLSVTLTPFINDFSVGPKSVLPDIFCPDYIANASADGKRRVCYRRQKPEETSFFVTLSGEIYAADSTGEGKSKKPEHPIQQGPLELGITEPYTFTIHTNEVLTRTDYDEFIGQIYQKVTTAAMYQILEIISRGATQHTEDMLYYHCGLSPEKRRADLRPGLALRLEQGS